MDAGKKEDGAQGSARQSPSASLVLGRLAGATVAVLVAASVFVTAALAGVPGPSALQRSVLAAVLLWFVTGLFVRGLFAVVLEDWRRKRRERKDSSGAPT